MEAMEASSVPATAPAPAPAPAPVPVPVPHRFLDDGKMFKGSKEVAAFECGTCKKKKIRYDRTKSHVCDPESA